MTSPSRQWRSLDEAPGVAHDEFLAPLPSFLEMNRREFFGVLTALAAFASSGCQRRPEKIVPRARDGDTRTRPGETLEYATAILRRGRAMGVLASCRDGRPIKLEGNPDHPATLGALDARGQAELLNFYHPKRASVFRNRGEVHSARAFMDELRPRLDAARASGGARLALLLGPNTSPTIEALIHRLREAMPGVRVYRHDPLDDPGERAGIRLALGVDAEILPDLSRAEVLVSFDADVLGDGPSCVRAARGFAARRVVKDGGMMSRVYVAEPVPTITGAAADHRLPVTPCQLESLLLAFAGELGLLDPPSDTLPARHRAWAQAAASDALRAGKGALVLGGRSLAPEMHALVMAINERLGGPIAVCEPVEFLDPGQDLRALTNDLTAGTIDTLLIVGANPVYTAPGELGFAEALDGASCVVHAGVFPDETAARATWSVPLAHPLESWGDARAPDGTLTILQPTIRPLYDAWTPAQLLAALTQPLVPDAMAVVREHHRAAHPVGFERWWRQTLHDGVAADSVFGQRAVRVRQSVLSEDVPAWMSGREPNSGNAIELVIRPDPTVGAGEDAHNEWLQELPKPITKIVWSNALELALADAERLGLREGDAVRVSKGDKAVVLSIWITPGHAEGCASATLGYGRDANTVAPQTGGGSVYPLCQVSRPWYGGEVRLEPVGRRERVVTTQHHGRMEGVDAVRVRTPHGLREAAEEDTAERRIPLTLYPGRQDPGPQWGMSIDLAACIGCSACTIACQAENNIPWVGPDQVHVGREMHWIRVDRYYSGRASDPTILHQPVPCMHCEKAPCEVVCPVGATQHSTDGLNEMVYNRCIGTRYCSNNCPYKVRRFNFLKFVDTEHESVKLMRNPEVSVRARGVMEKCTYCVQRIRNAEIEARIEDRELRDGSVVTACQQACPTRAIVFGDIADPNSAVSKARAAPRRYDLLGELGTRPRTTYLEDLRNPNHAVETGEAGNEGTP